jgi:hypothetical protein
MKILQTLVLCMMIAERCPNLSRSFNMIITWTEDQMNIDIILIDAIIQCFNY